jgi:hypothetical protein
VALLRISLLAMTVLCAAGCTNTTLDPSPIENFVSVSVTNDTPRKIEFHRCYNRSCSFHDVTDSVPPGKSGRQAFNNGTPSKITLRFASGGRTIGCIVLHAHQGQRRATVHVSAAIPCP